MDKKLEARKTLFYHALLDHGILLISEYLSRELILQKFYFSDPSRELILQKKIMDLESTS